MSSLVAEFEGARLETGSEKLVVKADASVKFKVIIEELRGYSKPRWRARVIGASEIGRGPSVDTLKSLASSLFWKQTSDWSETP